MKNYYLGWCVKNDGDRWVNRSLMIEAPNLPCAERVLAGIAKAVDFEPGQQVVTYEVRLADEDETNTEVESGYTFRGRGRKS